jgi:hypothetical protein
VTNKKNLESDKQSSSSPLVIIIIAASLAGFSYIQPELVESLTGFNLKKLIHGEEVDRSISSVPSQRENSSATQAANQKNAKSSGKLVLSGVDFEMEVYLNGTKAEYVGTPFEVELNKEVSLVVKKSGYLPFVKKVTLSAQEDSAVIAVPELEKARMGLLSTSQNYTAGSKIVYEEAGQTVERDLPLTDVSVAEGTYQAKIVNPILGTEKKVEFNIEENKKFFLE